jgi:serine/threonine protein phosphatase 1
MRPPIRRIARGGTRGRAALQAASVPTWNDPKAAGDSPATMRWLRAPGWLPRGRRVYAIGDIHGCSDKLRALHRAVALDLAERPVPAAVLVHIGDYIDQGPDSAGVLDVLIGPPPAPGLVVVNLMGDHERMLIDALAGDRAAATDWLWAGGRNSLASWGIDPALPRERWEAALPAAHVAFLRSLVRMHREGEYLFVHAGIRPGVALGDQTLDDLTTMRQPFLFTDGDLGAIVVHGHSNTPQVVTTTNRIAIDTGAGMGGRLTCVVLEEDLLGVLAA